LRDTFADLRHKFPWSPTELEYEDGLAISNPAYGVSPPRDPQKVRVHISMFAPIVTHASRDGEFDNLPVARPKTSDVFAKPVQQSVLVRSEIFGVLLPSGSNDVEKTLAQIL
jgi:hypothetical protein